MPILLSGRTLDYIRCAVRTHGSLIIVLASPTCQIEQISAIRPEFLMSSALHREFNQITCEKLLTAWGNFYRGTPLVCDSSPTEYLSPGYPEISFDVSDLYILG